MMSWPSPLNVSWMSGKIIASCKSARRSCGIFLMMKSSMPGIAKSLSLVNRCQWTFHWVRRLSGTGVITVSITVMTVSLPAVLIRISTMRFLLVCTFR